MRFDAIGNDQYEQFLKSEAFAMVMDCLGDITQNERDIEVLKHYYGIDGFEKLTPTQIGEKYGFSKQRANNIVNNTPNGLMVLDEELNIGLINNTMCKLLSLNSPDTVTGQHIAMILDPSDFFEALEGKKIAGKYEYLSEYERYIEKTISYDEKFKVLVAVFRDITEEELQKQEKFKIINNTVSITDSLLEQNMRSVHEIASLLGETAAETKIALEKLKGLVKSDGE